MTTHLLNMSPCSRILSMSQQFDTLCKGLAAVPQKAALVNPRGKAAALTQAYSELHVELCKDDGMRRLLSSLTKDLRDCCSDYSGVDARKAFVHRAFWFRTILELIFNFSSGEDPIPSFEVDFITSVHRFTKCVPSTSIVAYIKYFSVAPHARFFQNPLPDAPAGFAATGLSSFRVFVGPLGRWFQHMIIQTSNVRSQRFFYSWLQTKRGCAPMDTDDVMGTFVKHKKALTKAAKYDLTDESDPVAVIAMDRMLRKVQTLTSKWKLRIPSTVNYEFSHNACNTHSRAKGGQSHSVTGALATIQPQAGVLPHCTSQYITPRVCPGDFLFRGLFSETVKDSPLGNSAEMSMIMLDFLDDRSDPLNPNSLYGDDSGCFELPSAKEEKKLLHRYFKQDYESNEPIIGEFKPRFVEGDPLTFGYEKVEIQVHSQKGVNNKKVNFRPNESFDVLLGAALVSHTDRVVIAPILEPLKVRLVSKGDPLTYAASMPVQQQMHSYLRKESQFELIGAPLTHDNLLFLSQHPVTKEIANDSRCPGEWFWESGDYSAATDNLSIAATKLIFNHILTKLPASDQRSESYAGVLRHVLYEQTLEYPVKKDDEIKHGLQPARQVNGQLMGSTLSFPVLCIANLLTYWLALEDYYRERDTSPLPKRDIRPSRNPCGYRAGTRRFKNFADLPVLVNGDDILFAANRFLKAHWLRWVKILGFELSVGKSLSHANLATVNSQQWRFVLLKDRLQPEAGNWIYTPYFAAGLLVEGSAAKVKSADPVHHLSAAWNKLRTTSFSEIHAMTRFLSIHRDELKEQTKNGLLNLFVSPQNGGLGFDMPRADTASGELPWKTKYTRFQRAFAYARNLKHTDKITNKPDPAGIQVFFVDDSGKQYDYSMKNSDANNVSKMSVACQFDENDEPLFPAHLSETYCPLFTDPDLVTVNSSAEKFMMFEAHSSGDLKVVKTWKLPGFKEMAPLLKRSNAWRDSELASVSNLNTQLFYQPVVRMDPEALERWALAYNTSHESLQANSPSLNFNPFDAFLYREAEEESDT